MVLQRGLIPCQRILLSDLGLDNLYTVLLSFSRLLLPTELSVFYFIENKNKGGGVGGGGGKGKKD